MSEAIKVTAASGLKVSRESQPHRFINDTEEVEVPASPYYLRCLMYGDLVRVEEKTATPKGAK